MALTAVMKLFWVYLAPYSLFFSTARTEKKTQDNFVKKKVPLSRLSHKTILHCDVRYVQTFITFNLNGLSLRQTLLC